MDAKKTLKSDEKCCDLCMGSCGDSYPVSGDSITGTGGSSAPIDLARPDCDYCGKEGHSTEGITAQLKTTK